MSRMQRFNFVGDTASQFCEVSLDGTTVTIRYGTEDGDVKQTDTVCDSIDDGVIEYERLVARIREVANRKAAEARQRLEGQGHTPGEAAYAAFQRATAALIDSKTKKR